LAEAILTFVRRRAEGRDDRGDIVLGWFARVIVFLLFIGILAFESLSLVTTRVNSVDIAQQAAIAGAEGYAAGKTWEAAYAAAEKVAIERDAELLPDEFVVTREGAVDLALTKTATTLFLYRTEATGKWAVTKVSAHANARTH
jgi:hypothetical protein